MEAKDNQTGRDSPPNGEETQKIALGLLDGHVRHCMLGDGGAPPDPAEQVAELMGAVGRMVKR